MPKTDLTLNGSGSLTINAQAGHGVVSKDDLLITGGNYTITSASHGLSGKDCVAIADGVLTITSGKDGIHAENSDDLTLGWLYIKDGSFTIPLREMPSVPWEPFRLTAAPLIYLPERAVPA